LKKVLIIAYGFPPNPWVASLRSGGLAKYLPDYGWQPVILTPAMSERSNSTSNFKVKFVETKYRDVLASWRKRLGLNPDRSVMIQQKPGTDGSINSFNIINCLIKFANKTIAYPDEQKGWYPFAIKASEEFLQKERVNALISSSSPVTSHLIAKYLKTKFNIPWVADFRDLWTQNHYLSYNFIRKIVEKRLELKTISSADALVTVSQPWTEQLHHLHTGKTVQCIPNGFDPEELAEPTVQLTKKFTITYAGDLYAGKRDPSLLFEVLNGLIKEGTVNPHDVQIRFYGRKEPWLENKINLYNFQGKAKHYGSITREMVLEKQRESQILLLLNWNTPNPGEVGTCPAKLFEYLATKRPILAIGGPTGVVTEILKETGVGVHVSNLEDLRQVLLQYYQEYKEEGRVNYKGRKDKIMNYSHTEMARKFAQILSTVSQ